MLMKMLTENDKISNIIYTLEEKGDVLCKG